MDTRAPDHWWETTVAEINGLAERYGTPFYLHDADVVKARIAKVREALGEGVLVYYAAKANPNLALLRAIRETADGVDVSSVGEIHQALLAGFSMGQLSFAGPAKTAHELTVAIRNAAGCVSVESIREIELCAEIARRHGVRANIAVRVNPSFNNRGFALRMGGKAVQFGIDEEVLPAALETIQAQRDSLEFSGVHVYAGSQCFDVEAIVQGVQHTLRIVRDVEMTTTLACKTINVGGGFGVSHGIQSRELDVRALGAMLAPILGSFLRSSSIERKIIFELGRFLVAPAGMYVTRVVNSKESRGTLFFLVDGGLHHHLAAAGTFGAALRSNYLLQNLSRPHADSVVCTLAGPSCNPTDLIGIDVELPRPEHGDLIAVLKSGSYGLTASPLLFLGRDTPAELVRHKGSITLGRPRLSMDEFN